MNRISESAFHQAQQLIEQCEPGKAEVLLRDAMSADLENAEFRTAISFCSYWTDVFQDIEVLSPFDGGECLLDKWKKFDAWSVGFPNVNAGIYYGCKKGTFTKAMQKYSEAEPSSPSQAEDQKLIAEIRRKTGLCHKRLGEYEEALQCLMEANSLNPGQADIVAEFADCYDLCGEKKLSKILFREAFYIDPQKVDLGNLDSPLIQGLIKQVQQEGYEGHILQEWIPVYGILLGVFNVKRNLRAMELGRLRQDIFNKENELKDPSNNSKTITPRLMNLYLWLMDYYRLSNESTSRINELLFKIRLLDPEIYKEYFN
ncbi:MAG: hypothetical protein ILP07_00695 [Treponema sp.]|nr:hypothetical protein [Treponema sp.]MBR6297058.1 hypothetical protein [Treponema sp.]MEE3314327.1 hypothetical protein [Treponema sp.]